MKTYSKADFQRWGAIGGAKSKRVLTTEQALAMVKAREAKRPKKMKSIIAIATLMLAATVVSAQPINVERMADAIYRAEGGDKARVPYGVLSVRVKDKADARRITITSINNNIKRWDKAGKPGTFIDFMANRWCPVASDPVGNRNWKKNVTAIYNQTK